MDRIPENRLNQAATAAVRPISFESQDLARSRIAKWILDQPLWPNEFLDLIACPDVRGHGCPI